MPGPRSRGRVELWNPGMLAGVAADGESPVAVVTPAMVHGGCDKQGRPRPEPGYAAQAPPTAMRLSAVTPTASSSPWGTSSAKR